MKKWITKYYRITNPKIKAPDGQLRIVFLSDLHNVSIGTDNQLLLQKVTDLCPDLVLVGGDMIVGKPGCSMEIGLQFLKKLAAHRAVYAANGNHEYRLRCYPDTYRDMYDQYCQALADADICLLANDCIAVTVKQTPVIIYGYELDRRYYHRFKRQVLPLEQLTDAIGTVDPDCCSILLAHNPRYAETYFEWGADLVLCGHYHGGIVRLGRGLPVLGNDFSLFPKYAYGHHQKQHRHLITSAGLGEHTIPVRINNPRELVLIDIQRD